MSVRTRGSSKGHSVPTLRQVPPRCSAVTHTRLIALLRTSFHDDAQRDELSVQRDELAAEQAAALQPLIAAVREELDQLQEASQVGGLALAWVLLRCALWVWHC
jgi:hypothetical protein